MGLKDIFRCMEAAKREGRLLVLDWGVSRATLEEVFLRVSEEAEALINAA